MKQPHKAEHYIGMMMGSSLDAIDMTLIACEQQQAPRSLASQSFPLKSEWKKTLIDLGLATSIAPEVLKQWDLACGEWLADAALGLLNTAHMQAKDIRAIGAHGPTVSHQPQGPNPHSCQLGCGQVIASRTQIPTVVDFRSEDIQHGGQGAPLAPLFHQAFFQTTNNDRIIINIGGIANISFLPQEPNQSILGFDSGPGNTLLDACSEKYFQQAFDKDGLIAQSGQVNSTLLQQLLQHDFFKRQGPKSTGRHDFNLSWLQACIDKQSLSISPQDIITTLSELTAISIATTINSISPQNTPDIFLCGGGSHNDYLCERLQAHLPAHRIASTACLGIDPDYCEAMGFAWLAQQRLAGKRLNTPPITGAQQACLLGVCFQP